MLYIALMLTLQQYYLSDDFYEYSLSTKLHSKCCQRNLNSITNFRVIIVPADGLAPLGARPSAGTMLTQVLVPYIYGGGTLRYSLQLSITVLLVVWYVLGVQ